MSQVNAPIEHKKYLYRPLQQDFHTCKAVLKMADETKYVKIFRDQINPLGMCDDVEM